jgi:hypothetical protein
MQERCFRALSRAAMEMNACYSGPSWCHMLEEGGDARGMPALGEKPLLAMGSYHTCQVFMWKQDQMIRAGVEHWPPYKGPDALP